MDNNIILSEQQRHPFSTNAFSCKENFQALYDIGKMFSISALVPQAYQNKPMDCAIAIDMANRMGVSPLMVMQNLYIVKGKPSWSGQACMALIEGSGKFKNLHHIYFGKKGTDERGCYVQAVRVETGEMVEGAEVTLAMAKAEGWTQNSKWRNIPELMLAYRASAFFARVHVPNALMGIYVEGEVEDCQKIRRENADIFVGEEG